MLTVYVVRHGQTDHNLYGIVQGHINTPLNDTGQAQAQMVAKRLLDDEGVRFDMAFSSDSDRASDTGLAILERQGSDIVMRQQEELRERDMGELSGKSGPVPRPLPPSVESSPHFVKRCLSWWNETILPLARDPVDRTILVTSHGAYILTLFRQLATDTAHGGLGYPLTGQALREHPFRHCANTSISMVRVDQQGNGIIERFNDHAHLGGDMGLVVSKDVAA
ncbi:hypothetical protein NCC49_003848 [Naganishia albida]|nr:hypothetical protein NCC49_003848 [Naganishia albida]